MTDAELESYIADYKLESLEVFNRVKKFMDNMVFKRGYDPSLVANAMSLCSLIIYDDIFDDDIDYEMMLEEKKYLGKQLRKGEPA
jgi:hypothetical protein